MKKYLLRTALLFVMAFVMLPGCATAQKFKYAVLALNVPAYVTCFDKVPAVLDFSIFPYQGEGINFVEGKVMDINGATVAKVDCRPLDKIAGINAPEPELGGKRDYLGYVDQALTPGKYKIEIIHFALGDIVSEETDLEIFPTGLTEESANQVKTQLTIGAKYGKNVAINSAVPLSGNKISPNQFRTYLISDDDVDRPPIENYTVTREQGYFLGPKVNSFTYRITWVQPFTNTEVDLFPEQTFTVKQQNPRISMENKQQNVSGQEKKLSIRVTNITVTGSPMGDDAMTPSQVDAWLGNVDVKVPDYQLSGDAHIEKGDAGNYTITLDISGKLPRGETSARGTVTIPVFAKAKNTLNGKVSDDEKKAVVININYEPERPVRIKGNVVQRPNEISRCDPNDKISGTWFIKVTKGYSGGILSDTCNMSIWFENNILCVSNDDRPAVILLANNGKEFKNNFKKNIYCGINVNYYNYNNVTLYLRVERNKLIGKQVHMESGKQYISQFIGIRK